MEKFIVSARKYRPATFGSLIGQDGIATTLKNSIKRGQLAHAYLFCGPRGVGKTSTARIFAKIINCMNPQQDMEPCGQCESCKSFEEGRSYCIHELDAASNNSVDDIRALTEKVMIPPQIGKYSVYIIDEVHMLSTSAFNAFLKTLEEPPEHAIFILATTEKHKIIPTILSRCQVYDFNRISIQDIVKNLKAIATKEQVQIDDNSLHIIAEKADGAMRDALTLFDQVVAYCGNTVDYPSVIKNLNVLDYEYYFNLTNYSLKGSFADSLLLFNDVLAKGFNALYFVGGLGNHLRNLLICKEASSAKLLEVSPELEVKYKELSAKCPLKFLFKALAAVEKCEADYPRSNNQRLLVEFMLVRISQLTEGLPQQTPQIQQAPQQHTPAQTTVLQQPAAEQPQTAQQQQTTAQTTVQQQTTQAQQAAQIQQPTSAQQQQTSAQTTVQQQTSQTQQAAQTQQTAQIQQPTSAQTTVQQQTTQAPQQHTPVQTIVLQQPAAEQPQTAQQQQPQQQKSFAGGISINQLMESKKKEEKNALDFMGPSTVKPVTQEDVAAAWAKLVQFYEVKTPHLGRFIAALKEASPDLQTTEDSQKIIFYVNNENQKKYIEQQTGPQMAAFLRKALENYSIKLVVGIRREDIVKKMYMPQDKDQYLTETNPEFAQLKKDLGAELK